MRLSFRFGAESDLAALLALRLAVDADQAERFGDARWSTSITEKGVAGALRSKVLLAIRGKRIVGAARMETKKPWAIDLAYFTPVSKALYLHDVNVAPELQGAGIGRRLLEHGKTVAREWPVEAIRVDAYHGPSGAARFYAKCGFKQLGHTVYRGVPLTYLELVF